MYYAEVIYLHSQSTKILMEENFGVEKNLMSKIFTD